MPMGIAFLIFASKNPEISKKLGLISAKADLVKYSATDWAAYLGFYSLLIAAGGFILFVLIISWIFGREFADKTLKDMLAVPIHRWNILLAKFVIFASWSGILTITILLAGIGMGIVIKLPGYSITSILQGCALILKTAGLAILIAFPFAFFASAGRGYLLPIGMAVLIFMAANLAIIAGWGEIFPWAIPGIFAQGKEMMKPISFWIVVLTGFGGMAATYLWWMNADQSQ